MPAENRQNLDTFLGGAPSSALARYGWWLLLCCVLFGLFIAMRANRTQTKAEYITASVHSGDIEITVTATGNLAPTHQVEVGSEISGIVDRVLVEVNDTVKAGQAIAMIDTSRLDDSVRRAHAALQANEASVEREQATVVQEQLQLARLEAVDRRTLGAMPARADLSNQRAALNRANAALKLARANVASAQAQLSSDRTQLAKAVIRSPVSGVVLKRSIDPGQTVQAAFSTPSLFIIAEELSRMKLEVAVDEADVGRVRAGQSAMFTVDAYPRTCFPGRNCACQSGCEKFGVERDLSERRHSFKRCLLLGEFKRAQ